MAMLSDIRDTNKYLYYLSIIVLARQNYKRTFSNLKPIFPIHDI